MQINTIIPCAWLALGSEKPPLACFSSAQPGVLQLGSRQHFWLGFIFFLVPANAGNLPLPHLPSVLQFKNKTT